MGTSRGHNLQLLTLAALWTASALFMLFGTYYASPLRLAWAEWLALGASVLTIRWIVESVCRRERIRVEHLARIMAEETARLDDPDNHRGGSVLTLR